MLLTDQLRDSFSSAIVSRGQSYFTTGRVRLTRTERGRVESRVAGSRPRAWAVVIEDSSRPSDPPAVRCNCPSFRGGTPCKHIWATLLCIDAAQPPVWPHANGDTPVPTQFHDEDPEPIVPQPHVAPRAPAWRRQLQGIEAYNRSLHEEAPTVRSGAAAQVWYVLDLAETRRAAVLSLDVCYRTPRKDGSLGKLKPLNIAARRFPATLDSTTVELLALLVGNRLARPSQYEHLPQAAVSAVELGAAMHEIVLPRLCATGRLVAVDREEDEEITAAAVENAAPLTWDAAEPWRLRMSLAADDARECWSFDGRLERADEQRSLETARAVLGDGLVVFADSIARLDAADELEQFGWIVHLRGKAGINVPYSDRDAFLEELYSMSVLPPVELPADLTIDKVCLPPRGRLRVRTPGTRHGGFRNGLFAEVAFVYGDHAFALRDRTVGHHDARRRRVVLRDAERERELLGQIEALDLKPPAMSSYFRDEFDFYFHQNRLSEVVGTLSAAGWLLESDGVEIRRAGPLTLQVTSGVDWFELDGRIDFGGATASLPRLLEAVRRNERFIRLDDGSHGVVPNDWVERYGDLARLGVSGDEHLRFSRSQALLLDALLAEQDNVSVDRGFSAFRAKLATFDGIKPRGEPRGFRGELRDYQKDGHGWLHFLRELGFGGCLADDMGLGKTVQVLALLQARRVRRPAAGEQRNPSIVVVPKSLVFNWIDEAARFAPQLEVLEYSGTDRAARLAASERADDGSVGYDVLLTTYGTLRRDITRLREISFDYAILDEAQAIKNAGSQAAKASRLITADHRLAMTGTPVENHLGELWSLFEFLNPGLLGQSRVFDALRKNGGDDDTRTILAKALRPFMLRRTKQEVLTELPEKTEQTLHCVLSDRERRAYDELREYYRASLAERIARDGIGRSRIHVLEALLRLRQAACHPGLLDADRRGETSAKLEALLGHVEEIVDEGHKALIFSQFTSLLAIVREELDRRGTTYEYLDGRTRKRAERVKRFQEDPACPLFLVSLKAGGQGLNLTAADYVYILDPWWNPAVEAQAVDRAHRIGQSRHVFAYRLITSDTVEEKIVELQASKRELADAIISGGRGPVGDLTAEDVELLFTS